MNFNKEIISQIAFFTVIILIAARVFIPIFIDFIKGRSVGLNKETKDLDYLINKKKGDFTYQLNRNASTIETIDSHQNQHLINLKKESKWGNSNIGKEIIQSIQKDFSYQISDASFNQVLMFLEKNKLLEQFDQIKIEKNTLINFLISSTLFIKIVDEIKTNDLMLINKCAKRINVFPSDLRDAFYFKILLNIKSANQESVFMKKYQLSHFSDDTLNASVISIIKSESSLWSKSLSSLFEELMLYLKYAELLRPLFELNDKNDLENALKNLNSTLEDDVENVKNKYKKLAQIFHPDKIIPQKLPKIIEIYALKKFDLIKRSYDIASKHLKVK